FSPNENALEAKICRTIPQSESAFDQFPQIGGVGVEDTGPRLLAGQMALLSEQRQRVRGLDHAREVDHGPQVRAGSGQADVAQGATRARADVHDVSRSDLAAEEEGERSEGEVDAQFILRERDAGWPAGRTCSQRTQVWPSCTAHEGIRVCTQVLLGREGQTGNILVA